MGAVPGYRRTGVTDAARQHRLGKQRCRLRPGERGDAFDDRAVTQDRGGFTNPRRKVTAQVSASDEETVFSHCSLGLHCPCRKAPESNIARQAK
jgi:hypothetical protein